MPPEKLQSIQPTVMSNQPPMGGNAFSGWLGMSILKLFGWRFEGHLPQHSKMVLAVGPHTSNWDFFLGVAVLFALRIKIKFLGKHTIFIPIVRNVLEWLGGIAVDRSAKHGVVDRVVNEFNHSRAMILAVAPEGTRSPIYPWKTGFLNIATRAGVPVVLIGFDFKRKKIVFGPTMIPSGDIDIDMETVYHFFASVAPKYPQFTVLSEK